MAIANSVRPSKSLSSACVYTYTGSMMHLAVLNSVSKCELVQIALLANRVGWLASQCSITLVWRCLIWQCPNIETVKTVVTCMQVQSAASCVCVLVLPTKFSKRTTCLTFDYMLHTMLHPCQGHNVVHVLNPVCSICTHTPYSHSAP